MEYCILHLLYFLSSTKTLTVYHHMKHWWIDCSILLNRLASSAILLQCCLCGMHTMHARGAAHKMPLNLHVIKRFLIIAKFIVINLIVLVVNEVTMKLASVWWVIFINTPEYAPGVIIINSNSKWQQRSSAPHFKTMKTLRLMFMFIGFRVQS